MKIRRYTTNHYYKLVIFQKGKSLQNNILWECSEHEQLLLTRWITRTDDVPGYFLAVGYYTCHSCHIFKRDVTIYKQSFVWQYCKTPFLSNFGYTYIYEMEVNPSCTQLSIQFVYISSYSSTKYCRVWIIDTLARASIHRRERPSRTFSNQPSTLVAKV